MKRILIVGIFLVMAALIALAIHLFDSSASETESPSMGVSDEVKAIYEPILERNRANILGEKFYEREWDKLMRRSPEPTGGMNYAYSFVDLDDDGSPELVITCGDYVLTLYTIVDGEAKCLGIARNLFGWFINRDKKVYVTVHGEESDQNTCSYWLEDGELSFIEGFGVRYDRFTGNSSEFRITSDGKTTKVSEKVAEPFWSEKYEIGNGYRYDKISLFEGEKVYELAEQTDVYVDDVDADSGISAITEDGASTSTSPSVVTFVPESVPADSDVPPASASTSQTLRKGDRGGEVKALQIRLRELGYLEGEADGKYGSKTFNAVLAFQKANGLKVDGVAGPKTLEALYNEE